MGALFGKKRNSSSDKNVYNKTCISNKDKAVYELKVQRDRLVKFQIKNDVLIEKETNIARQLVREGQKDRAKLVLRKKKYHESLIANSYDKLSNIDEMVNSIRFSEMSVQVFQALSEGNDVLKEINSAMSIDDVEKLMDESAESIAYQNEVSAMLSTQLTPEDDSDVLAQLDMIEQSQANALADEIPEVPVRADDQTTQRNERQKDDSANSLQSPPKTLLV